MQMLMQIIRGSEERAFFLNVEDVEPLGIEWSSTVSSETIRYRVLLSICQLVIEGMLLTTDDGEYKLASFVDDQRMNRL